MFAALHTSVGVGWVDIFSQIFFLVRNWIIVEICTKMSCLLNPNHNDKGRIGISFLKIYILGSEWNIYICIEIFCSIMSMYEKFFSRYCKICPDLCTKIRFPNMHNPIRNEDWTGVVWNPSEEDYGSLCDLWKGCAWFTHNPSKRVVKWVACNPHWKGCVMLLAT